MNNFLEKMEKKLGRFAVPRLTLVIIGCYVIGYIIQLVNSNALNYMTLDPCYIFQGQIWRLITWIIIPPSNLSSGLNAFFAIVMLIFYLSIGSNLEKAWGDFKYNVYIFGGMIFTVIAAFICYPIFPNVAYGAAFSTYYICMSIFLGFAMTFPETKVYLYFIIPIKMKWMALVYAALMIYDVVQYARLIAMGFTVMWVEIIAIIASLLNCLIFFLATRNIMGKAKNRQRQKDFTRRYNAGSSQRIDPNGQRQAYRSNGSAGAGAAAGNAGASQNAPKYATPPRHKCEICGRTERTDPEMDFRYCSKCRGAHEYCPEHLFTHLHIE